MGLEAVSESGRLPAVQEQLAKTYGDLYTVWLGQTPIIVLNGCKVIREALVSHAEEFSGRPTTTILADLLGERGIVMSNGQTWKQQRRFGLTTLRNLGLGKRSLEERIKEEAQHLMEVFARKKGTPLDPASPITNSVTNVISALVFGHRFSVEDGLFSQLVEATDSLVENLGSFWSRLYDAFPRLMPYIPGSHHKVFQCQDFLKRFVKKEIRSHRERGRLDEPQDLIDFYDSQILKTKDDPNAMYDEENMVQVMIDLFVAGTETTTTTLRWALLYMVTYPEIQEKVQKELDAVLGSSQIIHYEDRKRLPYTNAVIHEIQRFGNIAGFGIVRQCVKETNLQGFTVSKGTIILPNISSALYDPEHWETPRQFNPSHFLDKEGNFVTKDAFIPFSAGHRVCFGEQLARTELFIFFCSLLQAFTFQLPDGVKKISLDYIFGATLKPYPYKICAVPR
ncbi:cytochrome P450 2J5-like [Rhinatrema bivittatum]|uniref:cytochrome P450 2J5-like n=1 Tax=Rhinatrema bivittatum TaxID=194408 RepID=UPI00112D2868|nr:cytochrome P450 2J5-like [Rhinatrema bivittatum]